jgi:hypothetical protein
MNIYVMDTNGNMFQDVALNDMFLWKIVPHSSLTQCDCDSKLYQMKTSNDSIYMFYSTTDNSQINWIATRILVDLNLLDPPITHNFSGCVRGNVVFHRRDNESMLVDLTSDVLFSLWHNFFVQSHPSVVCYNNNSGSKTKLNDNIITTKYLQEPISYRSSQTLRIEIVKYTQFLIDNVSIEKWLQLSNVEQLKWYNKKQ